MNLEDTRSLSPALVLAGRVAELFASLPQVRAIALSGSQTGGQADAASDIDLYVYTQATAAGVFEIPLEERKSIIDRCGGAAKASLGLNFWGPGDEWFDAATGIEVDIVYFAVAWMETQVGRIMRHGQASLGYSTCPCHTVLNSKVLYDPHGWFAALQRECQGYPETLRTNIIALNHPVLRSVIPAYSHQLEKAVRRGDLVSINHRLAALLASYFDILFAFNRVMHPGEKRLVEAALTSCSKLPVGMAADIAAIFRALASSGDDLLPRVDRLLDRLDDLLAGEGFERSLF